MVATPSTIYATPAASETLEVRLRDMERLADAGEWEKIERQLKRVPQLIAAIPVAERREAVLAARATVDRIRDRAAQSRHEVTQRLATLKTGRQATESYRQTSAMTVQPHA